MRGRFTGLRVWFLVAFGWPLLLKLPIGILFGQGPGLLVALLGIGLLVMAGLRMQRGQAGDMRRGAVLFGVAAGLVSGLVSLERVLGSQTPTSCRCSWSSSRERG